MITKDEVRGSPDAEGGVSDRTMQRFCPAHGLSLRPWHRVGKVECPDSACMYAEPHVCETMKFTACECVYTETVHHSPRVKPGCKDCHVVTAEPPPGSTVKEIAHHKRILAEGVVVGDAQCTGRCFDHAEWKEFEAFVCKMVEEEQ